jgi:hypothetical protein
MWNVVVDIASPYQATPEMPLRVRKDIGFTAPRQTQYLNAKLILSYSSNLPFHSPKTFEYTPHIHHLPSLDPFYKILI